MRQTRSHRFACCLLAAGLLVLGAAGSSQAQFNITTLKSPNEEEAGGFGGSVSGAGDVNGDRVAALIVGSIDEGPDPCHISSGFGRAYIFAATALAITLTPGGLPIQIPAAGGEFQFTVTLTSYSNHPQNTQVWNRIKPPTGEPVGPTIGPVNVTLGAGETISVTLTQEVPAGAAAGQYTYLFNTGKFPARIRDSDSFMFTKLSPTAAMQASMTKIASDWTVLDPKTNRPENASAWENSIAEDERKFLPEGFVLEQNYPNPFNPETEIRFQLPEANHVVVIIFNLLGQEIRTLADKQYEAGFHALPWDGKANNGNLVASGIYLYQLQAGSFSQVKKMTLLR